MSQVESGHQVHLPAPHSTNTLCSQNFFNIQHYQVILLPAKCYLVCIINIYRWIATFCAKKFLKWKNEFIVALNERPSCSLLYHSQHSALTADWITVESATESNWPVEIMPFVYCNFFWYWFLLAWS